MTSSERTRELSDILASYGDVWTFTEAQEAPVGEVLADEEVDADLRDVVARMRAQYDFATPFDDEALAVLVRRFYAGDDDEELLAALDSEAATLRAARFDLHLFRENEQPQDEHEHEAMREASRAGHRWNAEFETVLSEAGYPFETSWNPLGDVLASTDEGENVASAN
jgi:hypothetical protein